MSSLSKDALEPLTADEAELIFPGAIAAWSKLITRGFIKVEDYDFFVDDKDQLFTSPKRLLLAALYGWDGTKWYHVDDA